MIPTRLLRRPRVLIVGCGDVGLRCAALLRPRYRVYAVTRQAGRSAGIRAAGAVPIAADLDVRSSLRRLRGLAGAVLHLAPPQPAGLQDLRTRALLAAICRRVPQSRHSRTPGTPSRARWRAPRAAFGPGAIVPEPRGATGGARFPWRRGGRVAPPAATKLVYASTTGVYGNCDGALIEETRCTRPTSARARRRVSAEAQLRRAGARHVLAPVLMRIPGIYADGRLPLARLERGTPALTPQDDVFTSHVHADDLAAIMIRALQRGRAQRVVHACDDTQLKMADYFDLVADAYAKPRPPRVSRAVAEATLDAALLSFMRESRRLRNTRLKLELGYRLRYPTVMAFLDAHAHDRPLPATRAGP